MSVTSPVTGRVTGIVASGVTRAIGHRTRVIDADALAYIAAVEAADGEALEAGVKAAYIDFIDGCKADGIWTAIKASCILAGARTLAGCLVPLVGTAPTNVGPFVSGDYNRITGLKGNASTKYLDSNRNNNADPQNDCHVAANISVAGAIRDLSLGSTTSGTTTGNTVISYVNPMASRMRSTDSVTGTIDPTPPGFAGLSRSSSANYTARAKGVSETITSVSSNPSTQTFKVYRYFNNYADSTCNFYSIGESLNLANLETRVTALMTAIGAAIGVDASGGEVTLATIDGTDYKIHTFTTSADFVVSGGTLAGVERLIVAGGGGGGANNLETGGAGGGGAGGLLSGAEISLEVGTYPVVIGAGGAGANSAGRGGIGSSSTFDVLTAIGGGGGGGRFAAGGGDGGSGGGSRASGPGGSGTAGQGNNGGSSDASTVGGGGGGGAGAVGGSTSSGDGGIGGAGSASSITGASFTYAGGGGGSCPAANTPGTGGDGGGGDGESGSNGVAGTANRGGGGGGSTLGSGGVGGSGIVIIRYPI